MATGRPRQTRTAQQAGIQETMLSFTHHRRPTVPTLQQPLQPSPQNPFTPYLTPTAQLYPETPTRAPASVSALYLDNPWAPEPQGPLSPLQTPAHFPPAESTYLRTGTYQPTGFHTPVPLSPALPTVLEQMETESTDHSGSEPAEICFLRNQTQLTEAIHLMARNMSNMPMMQPRQEPTPRPKLKAPDVFDGTSAQKLDPFLVQCMMYISLQPHEFTTEDSKVGFIMLYLSGSPYNWFQSQITAALETGMTQPLPWLSDVALFVQELKQLFGPRDPVADARQNEINREKRKDNANGKSGTSNNNSSNNSGSSNSKGNSAGSSSGSGSSNSKSGSNSSNNSKDKDKSKSKGSSSDKPNPLADKLGADGKLKPEERERRLKGGLCLFCGKAGHVASDCRKRNSAKGCASSTTAAPPYTASAPAAPAAKDTKSRTAKDKSKADTLAPHHPYDLKIDLEEGAEPPLGRMYSLSPTELQALREFLEENTRSKFI
ncbi:unnamed protein product [Cyclocybe aegerita]|uniref:CCHC-type domain-containing protein n=1 Tax=Cyclocybe aegerita TaxID=1973307 RepID=A0A8S0VZ49_CYCAE|nr:unnamed protein product [Cyclocybe aegerita]